MNTTTQEITADTWTRKGRDYVIGPVQIRLLNQIADASEKLQRETYENGIQQGVIYGQPLPIGHPTREEYEQITAQGFRTMESNYIFHAITTGTNRLLTQYGYEPQDTERYRN